MVAFGWGSSGQGQLGRGGEIEEPEAYKSGKRWMSADRCIECIVIVLAEVQCMNIHAYGCVYADRRKGGEGHAGVSGEAGVERQRRLTIRSCGVDDP